MTRAALMLAVLLVFSARPAHAGYEFTPGDWAMLSTYSALRFLDWQQTRDIARHPDLQEANPLLGKHPSRATINIFFIVSILGAWGLSGYLDNHNRKLFLGAGIFIELIVVNHNSSIGLNFSF